MEESPEYREMYGTNNEERRIKRDKENEKVVDDDEAGDDANIYIARV